MAGDLTERTKRIKLSVLVGKSVGLARTKPYSSLS